LPRLLELSQLRGTFHNHTTESDGVNTLEEMAEEAMELGLQYLGIADHSKSMVIANGLTEERLLRQITEIRALNAGFTHCTSPAGSVTTRLSGSGTGGGSPSAASSRVFSSGGGRTDPAVRATAATAIASCNPATWARTSG